MQHLEHREALELSVWDASQAVQEVLEVPQETTARLEVEDIPTGLRAFKYLWRFVCIMSHQSLTDFVARLSTQQRFVVPMTRAMEDKMLTELDHYNWVFAMPFISYMDPSDES